MINLCAFIHKFRNYQTHYQIEFAYSDTQKNTVVFLSENLLKDKNQWNAESREFILENGNELNVAQIFSDYRPPKLLRFELQPNVEALFLF